MSSVSRIRAGCFETGSMDMLKIKTAARGSLSELLALASPVILSRLGIMVMGLTDAIVVGHHSSIELGYHALGWAPTMIALTTGVGLLTGVQVLTAQRVGEGRPEDAGAVLRRGLAFAAVVGLVFGTALWFGAAPAMHAIGLEPALAEGAAKVARTFALSTPAYLLSIALIFWLEALGRPGPAAALMWGANIVNLAANLWLVPGTSPFPVEGAVGSATATFIARTALVVGLAAYLVLWSDARRRYGLFAATPGAPGWKPLVWIGGASAASLFVETTAFAGMNAIAGLLGGLQAAAWAVVFNVSAIVFMVPLGFASATAVLVGRGFGERSPVAVRRSGMLGLAATGSALVVIAAIVALLPETIVGAYTTDPSLIVLAVPAMALSSLFFVADGLQVVAANALRARDDVWLPTLTHTISYAGVMLPLGYVLGLPLGMGLIGLVWSVVIASLFASGFLLTRFWWLSRRSLAPQAEALQSLA